MDDDVVEIEKLWRANLCDDLDPRLEVILGLSKIFYVGIRRKILVQLLWRRPDPVTRND